MKLKNLLDTITNIEGLEEDKRFKFSDDTSKGLKFLQKQLLKEIMEGTLGDLTISIAGGKEVKVSFYDKKLVQLVNTDHLNYDVIKVLTKDLKTMKKIEKDIAQSLKMTIKSPESWIESVVRNTKGLVISVTYKSTVLYS